jgi:hypothetical protein
MSWDCVLLALSRRIANNLFRLTESYAFLMSTKTIAYDCYLRFAS